MTRTHVVEAGGERFEAPIRSVGPVGIAYLDFVCDRRLIRTCASELAGVLPASPGAIVVPATGAIPLGYALAELLDRPLVVLRKGTRAYMDDVIGTRVRSVASATDESLVLESCYLSVLRRHPVTLLDTVTTTGSTLRAMDELMSLAEVPVAEHAVCFVEGDHQEPGLVHLGRLPVFASET